MKKCIFQKLLTIFLLSSTAISVNYASNPQGLEYRLKALYIIRLAEFIIWPENSEKTTFQICIDSTDQIAIQIKQSAVKEINGRELEIVDSSTALKAQCDFLYLSHGNIDPSLSRIPVVTVSSQKDFAEQGGMIEFYIDGAKLRMKANLQSANKAGIKLRSKLVRLLNIVKQAEKHDE